MKRILTFMTDIIIAMVIMFIISMAIVAYFYYVTDGYVNITEFGTLVERVQLHRYLYGINHSDNLIDVISNYAHIVQMEIKILV